MDKPVDNLLKTMNKLIKTREKLGIKGVQKFTVFDVLTKEAEKIENHIQEFLKKGPMNPKEYRYWVDKLKNACRYKEMVVENLVVLTGRAVIAQRLGGTNTYSLNISHGALGTSDTAPANGDTTLGAEVNRIANSTVDVSDAGNGVVILSYFWSKNSFTNSTINEFGTFIDASATPDSGQLFSHVTFADTIDKTSSKSITVDATYTIS